MSVRIDFDLNELSPQEAQGLIAMLQTVKGVGGSTKVERLVVSGPTDPPISFETPLPEESRSIQVTVGGGGGSTPPAEFEGKRRRGRPSNKDRQALSPETPETPEPPQAPLPETPEPSQAPALEPPAANPIQVQSGPVAAVAPSLEPPHPLAVAGSQTPMMFTVDELRQALQNYTVATDLKHAKELLGSYGCVRITDMADKDAATQTAFIAKCELG